jgi:hypothetical protein
MMFAPVSFITAPTTLTLETEDCVQATATTMQPLYTELQHPVTVACRVHTIIYVDTFIFYLFSELENSHCKTFDSFVLHGKHSEIQYLG